MERKDLLLQVREAKVLFGANLLKHPDIHGIGIGYKKTGRKKTNELALVVHVYKKLPESELRKSRIIPRSLTFYSRHAKSEITIPIDVREAIPPVPEVKCGDCDEDLEARVSPIPGGYSIGLVGVGGGTLGGWVYDNDDRRIVLISCEHVLGSNAGDHVIQPSDTDLGSDPADHFADVVRSGSLDATIAAPNNEDGIELTIACSGPAVYEITDAVLDMEVEKVGQTTGLTCGIVDLIDYDSGHYNSHNDIWIDGNGSDFSRSGDSGSLYVEMNHPDGAAWKRIIGIHWGGSGNDGIGHPIGAVFNDLNLAPLCEGMMSTLVATTFSLQLEEENEETNAPVNLNRIHLIKRRRKEQLSRYFIKDLEKHIQSFPLGKTVLDTIRKNRIVGAKILRNRDGWRAAAALLRSFLSDCITTDDVLKHKITGADIKNFLRLLNVAKRIIPTMKDTFIAAERFVEKALGKTISSFLSGSKE